MDRVYRIYYETLAAAARTGAFDVVAHFDLPKLWGQRPTADLSELEEEVLREVAAAGMAVEINTSGLDRHPVAEALPVARHPPARPRGGDPDHLRLGRAPRWRGRLVVLRGADAGAAGRL